jgi:hypothetical protein
MSPTHPEVVREEDVRIAEGRRRVEERLAALRSALRSDFGLVPRTGSWVLPAVGLAVGFGLALRALQRRPERPRLS